MDPPHPAPPQSLQTASTRTADGVSPATVPHDTYFLSAVRFTHGINYPGQSLLCTYCEALGKSRPPWAPVSQKEAVLALPTSLLCQN